MLKIGLTGGIGSGKSHVADLLGRWGAAVIDTDLIAHALTAPGGQAIAPIQEQFGVDFITAEGALDRTKMRDQVFTDSTARARLEAILHPLIAQDVRVEAEKAQGTYHVFVVPLLVESGRWLSRVDRVCVVDCDQETQVARVQKRSGLTLARIESILAAQASRDQRLSVAHDVIQNGTSVSLEQLERQVLGLHQQWCNLEA